jgi:nicotinamidase-related amidase
MFGCCGEPRFMEAIASTGKKKVILCGMETHVCVLQTCLGLLEDAYTVHVVKDAVCSRTEENYRIGIGFMRDAGAVITGTETVLFQLLERAGTEEFRAISKRIK